MRLPTVLSFDHDGLLFRHGLLFFLFGDRELQNAVFETGLYFFLGHLFADVEAPAHGACVSFAADDPAFVILLFLVEPL